MHLFQLGWKNLLHRPWGTVLSLLLIALGAGLISLMLLINRQLEGQFERNLAGIDLVIGAKGSPLQLILSSMYHLDAPTGNIPIAESKAFLNPRHPYIAAAVPLSLGDSYRGFRIVGTRPNFLELYEATVAVGEMWTQPMQVVAGAAVAAKLSLQVGDTFRSSHGLIDDADLEHTDAEPFRVVGILAPSGTVADQLLLTANESLWVVHGEHEHSDEPAAGAADTSAVDHADHDHADHDHDHADHADHAAIDLSRPLYEYEDRSITAILAKFKGTNIQTLNMQRGINENTSLQAATPAIEINRLYAILGTGERILRGLAYVIIIVSTLSIFISLYANLDERRYELALLRTLGASRGKLFRLIILEGVLLAGIGALLGLLFSHLGLAVVAQLLEASYRYDFTAWTFLPAEGYLLLGALGVGLLAALIPAIRASRTDIHETLAEG